MLYQDSIYTERFLGLPPGKRSSSYKDASLLNKVEKLRNKQYLLIHGTQDDNVHYQQSMFLAKALELRDIQFRQQVSIIHFLFIRLIHSKIFTPKKASQFDKTQFKKPT